MERKRREPEEIVGKLRQVEVVTGQGGPVADAVRSIKATEVTQCRRRSEHGGLKLDQQRRPTLLETESGGLWQAVAAPTLGKPILKEADAGSWVSRVAGRT